LLQMSAIRHLLAMQTHNGSSLVATALHDTLFSINWSCCQSLDHGGSD